MNDVKRVTCLNLRLKEVKFFLKRKTCEIKLLVIFTSIGRAKHINSFTLIFFGSLVKNKEFNL